MINCIPLSLSSNDGDRHAVWISGRPSYASVAGIGLVAKTRGFASSYSTRTPYSRGTSGRIDIDIAKIQGSTSWFRAKLPYLHCWHRQWRYQGFARGQRFSEGSMLLFTATTYPRRFHGSDKKITLYAYTGQSYLTIDGLTSIAKTL